MACALCPTELPSAPGLTTCWRCHDRLRDSLDPGYRGDLTEGIPGSIPYLYSLLSVEKTGAPDPDSRRAPGFNPAAPIDAHASSLLDPRSRANGRAWTDRADRWHWEEAPETAPLHAGNVLGGFVRLVAEERSVDVPRVPDLRPRDTDYVGPQRAVEAEVAVAPLPPTTRVRPLAEFLHRHVDYVCSRGWVDAFADELHQCHAQLRYATAPITGENRPRWIGFCAEPARDTVPDLSIDPADDPLQGRPRCNTPLYSPRVGSTIKCRGCGAYWERRHWLILGAGLEQAAAS